ncbi:MAG: roadblock/LC7 domain-containing protein [Thermoplasmata archaeon]
MNKEYEKIFEEISNMGARGLALVSRDGMVHYSDLPGNVHEETFGIMVATLVGAAKTANTELDMSSPSKIIIDSVEGRVVTSSIGKDHIITVVVGQDYELAPLFKYLDEVTKNED